MRKIWMLVAGFAAVSFAGAQETAPIPYDHIPSGFQFSYPKEWKLAKSRDHITLTIPYDDVKRTAQIEVYAVTFWSEIQIWQTAQATASKTDKREIVKQWQEEILTVPMLFSRTQWTDKDGESITADNSLIYAATRRRLAFRVVSKTVDWDRTEANFRTVLQSLKWDGGIPKPLDPSKQEQEYFVPEGRSKETIWRIPAKLPVDPVKGDQTIEATASGIALLVRFATPWKSEGQDLGLAHPDVSGAVIVKAYTAAESDPPGKALMKASANSLDAFTKVLKREEKGPLTNRGGSTYGVIWRQGTGKEGPLLSLDAVVSAGDYYVIVHWESNDPKASGRAKDRVFELVNSISVEVKPSS